MASVATWSFLFILYYCFITLVVTCMSFGGMFDSANQLTAPDGINITSNSTAEVSVSAWNAGRAFADVFLFSTIGVNLGLGGFGNFLVSFIFVYIPAILTALLIAFAIRSGSS